jgi:hypothetical protein
VVSNRSIRRYRWRGPRRPPSHTWGTFLRNHAHHLWAAYLLTVPAVTFKTLYVLVFITHAPRELVYVDVTANRTAAWVWRQLIQAMPWRHKPRHLLRLRDALYGRDFRQRARRIGIDARAELVLGHRHRLVDDERRPPRIGVRPVQALRMAKMRPRSTWWLSCRSQIITPEPFGFSAHNSAKPLGLVDVANRNACAAQVVAEPAGVLLLLVLIDAVHPQAIGEALATQQHA